MPRFAIWRRVRELGDQFRNRLPRDGIAQARGDFSQWFQHESPPPESRVRHGQPRLVDNLIAKQHQIEIERPRRASKRALASPLGLDCQQGIQHASRRQLRFADHRRVEERRLLALDSFGFRFVGRRRADALKQSPQPRARERHVGFAIPEVRADRNGDKRQMI